MTTAEIASLKAEYPEVPAWIIEREGMTLKAARELMELRRNAFPKTKVSK